MTERQVQQTRSPKPKTSPVRLAWSPEYLLTPKTKKQTIGELLDQRRYYAMGPAATNIASLVLVVWIVVFLGTVVFYW